MLGGCVRRLVLLGVLFVMLAGAWLFRDRIRTAWREFRGTEEHAVQPSPELAAAAERKLQSLRDGSSPQVALSAIELQSLLQYRYEGVLPAFLDNPAIELRGEQLRLRARVPVDNLPRVQGLAEAAAFLPDTTEMVVAGKLLPLREGRVAFAVDEVSAAGFPLPRRLVRPALDQVGRRDEPGLPGDAIGLPLPPGAAAAYVRRDSLVLLARGVAPPE
jgi:hypothetical protein